MTRSASTSRSGAAARGILFLRLIAGGYFLVAGADKFAWHRVGGVALPVVSSEWQRGFPQQLSTWVTNHPGTPLTPVVRDLFVPKGTLAAGVVAWAQLTTGALLLAGWLTSFAAVVGVAVIGMLALAVASDRTSAASYLFVVAGCVALIIGRAGEVMGIDAWRRERRRNREL